MCRVVRPELGDYQQQMEDTINVGELVKELASVRGQMAAREEKLMDNIQKLRKRMKEAATLERDTVDQAERGDDWDTLVLSEISFPSLAAPTPWDHTLAMVSERVTKLGAEVVSLKKVCLVSPICWRSLTSHYYLVELGSLAVVVVEQRLLHVP